MYLPNFSSRPTLRPILFHFVPFVVQVTFLNITGFRDFPLGDLPMLEVLRWHFTAAEDVANGWLDVVKCNCLSG